MQGAFVPSEFSPRLGRSSGLTRGADARAALLGKLVDKQSEGMFASVVFGGWIEFAHGRYRLADAADGFFYDDLSPADRRQLVEALER